MTKRMFACALELTHAIFLTKILYESRTLITNDYNFIKLYNKDFQALMLVFIMSKFNLGSKRV